MKRKTPSALFPIALWIAFAVMLSLQAPSQSEAFASPAQKRANAPAKKPTVNAENTASDRSVQASEDADIERITVDELKAKIAKGEPLTILDDRSEGSFDSSETQIKGSIRMTVDEIQSRIKEIPRDREIVTYCT